MLCFRVRDGSASLRVAAVAIVMRKSLRLDMRSLGRVSIGHVVTLASSDVEKFQAWGCMMSFFVLAPAVLSGGLLVDAMLGGELLESLSAALSSWNSIQPLPSSSRLLNNASTDVRGAS